MTPQKSPLTIVFGASSFQLELQKKLEQMGYCHVSSASREEIYSMTMVSMPHVASWPTRHVFLYDVQGLGVEVATAGVHHLLEHLNGRPLVVFGAGFQGSLVASWLRDGIVDYLDWPCSEKQIEDSMQIAESNCDRMQVLQSEYQSLKSRLDLVTRGEMQVMEMVLQGVPNKLIANKLDIAERTVEARRQKVYTKMQATKLAELIRSVDRLHWLGHELKTTHLDHASESNVVEERNRSDRQN